MKYPIPHYPRFPCFKLDEGSLIGQGNKRKCYAHPSDPSRCIKVARHLERWDECQEQTIVEWYYLRFLKHRQVPMQHVANCYGWVSTGSGAGLDLEWIRDDDGTPSLTLRNAILDGAVTLPLVQSMLSELRTWAIVNAVVIVDLNIDNLIVRWRNSSPHLVIIDGLGGRHANWRFTLYRRVKFFARFKTKRQWQRQEKKMLDIMARMAEQRLQNIKNEAA